MTIGRGYQPLRWTARGRWSPESVRGAHPDHSFPKDAVVAMLDAADEAHKVAIYAENDEGGKARGVVADTAYVLGVDIDEGDGHRWSLSHMVRVVEGARTLRDELENLRTTTADDQRHISFQNEQISRLTDEANLFAARVVELEGEAASDVVALRATIVRQANEITALKGESA